MEESENSGKAIGGHARIAALTLEQRKDLAKKAAASRWSTSVVEATHGSSDQPLRIGDIEIPCYVVEGDIRVLSQRGLQAGIGMSTSGGSSGANRLAQFFEGLTERGLECNDLAERLRNPIKFRLSGGGMSAYGYEATILADICDAILAARKGNLLLPNQTHYADQCELLVRGFARVGIIALVDEATGFQQDRQKDALAKILEAFIAKEIQPYLPTFPAEFYKELFRLRGLDFNKGTVKRPQYFGLLTNEIIYKRLAPNVLEELKKVTPKDEQGRNKHKLFQRLTANKGYPKLREHLGATIAVMKLSDKWHDFVEKMDRFYPKYGSNLSFYFEGDYNQKDDSGSGL